MSKPAYACCDKPDPAILEKNGRLFCRSCRAYLDQPTDGARPTNPDDQMALPGAPRTFKLNRPVAPDTEEAK